MTQGITSGKTLRRTISVSGKARFTAWLYEVDGNHAVLTSQNTGWDFNNPGKGGWVADRPDAFWTVTRIRPEVLYPAEHACQGLMFDGRKDLTIIALHVYMRPCQRAWVGLRLEARKDPARRNCTRGSGISRANGTLRQNSSVNRIFRER